MLNYYSRRKKFFKENYWNKNHNDILIPNGMIEGTVDLVSKLKIYLN